MKIKTGRYHRVADPVKIDLAFEEGVGLPLPGHLCVHQRMPAVLLHRSELLHVGEQIRYGASLAVRDSTCSLLDLRGLLLSLSMLLDAPCHT